jgi:AcrR family transcriptional regulator
MTKVKEAKSSNEEVRASLGRKRDDTLDARLIESAIDVLAEVGFDGMTMDMVAARAKAGKAGVYRRWASKAELVRDALIAMSRSSVELDRLPDTGSLRGDLLAVLKPYSSDHGDKKFRVLSGLGSFFSAYRKSAEEATAGIFEPWTAVNRSLMLRAVERGELHADADIEMACQVIIAMTAYRTLLQSKPFDKKVYGALLDNVLLPALKNPVSTGRTTRTQK